MSTHLEIESKFDAADGQALPDLVGVGGVDSAVAPAEMVLTATYFDTADLALGAAGATLRRRTGGADDGWHLKLPVADGERLEVRRSLGRSASPPAALLALLPALVRSEPVAPVATLVTTRSVQHLLDAEGTVLVEVADDAVVGERIGAEEPVSWREVEVELVEGDRAALAAVIDAMRAAGFSPATGSSKVGRVLGTSPASLPKVRRKSSAPEVLDAGRRASVRSLITADPLVRVDRPGAAGRMRVAVRRLRSALALSATIEPRAADDGVRSGLSWLDDVLAPLDRVDVVGPRLRAAVSAEPGELVLGPVSRRLDRELAAARKTALADLRAVLESPRYLDLLSSLTQLDAEATAGAGDVRAGDLLPELAERSARRAERRLAQLHRAQSEQERTYNLAGARRAVERARYAEALRPGGSDDAVTVQLDELAEMLAELAASAWTQDLLRPVAVQAQLAGENGFTFGRLHGLEELRAHELQGRLNAARKKLKHARSS